MEIKLTTKEHSQYVEDTVTFTESNEDWIRVERKYAEPFEIRKEELNKVLYLLSK